MKQGFREQHIFKSCMVILFFVKQFFVKLFFVIQRAFKNRILSVSLLLVALMLFGSFANAGDNSKLVVSGDMLSERFYLANFLTYLHDDEEQWNWQEIISKSQEFQLYGIGDISPDLGVLEGNIWFLVKVLNEGSTPVDTILEVPTGLVEHIELFIIVDGELEQHYRFDEWGENSIAVNGYARILTLKPGTENQLLFLTKTRLHTQFPVYLNVGNGFAEFAVKSRLLEILIYGILLAFALYHAFLFFVSRDKADLTLVFYILVMSFEFSSNQGYHHFIPWLEQYEMYWIKSVSGNLVLISFMLQFVTYLTVKQRYPITFRVFVASVSTMVLTGLLSGYFLGSQYMIACLLIAGLILVCMSLYVLIRSLSEQYRPARYYLVAMLCPIVGGGLIVAYYAGLLPPSISQYQPMYLLLLMTALQLMVLSMGMSERVKFLKAEHERNKQEIVLADARSEAKGDILAQMSHEIRTPINGILGVVELIRNTQIGAFQEFLVGMMEQSGTRLLRTINNILEYSKLEAGKGKAESISFDLWGFLFEVMDVFSLSAARRETNLQLQFENNIPHYVKGDSDRFKKILYELLDNAISFTPIGRGEVILKVCWDAHSAMPLQINIIDDGRGISDEMKGRIFEDLWQDKIQKIVSTRGAGLGLTVAKRNVDLVGGDIGFTAVEDGGTNFWLRFPFSKQEKVEALMDKNEKNIEVIALNEKISSPYTSILDSLSIPNNFLEEGVALRRLLVGDKEILNDKNTLLVISSGLKGEVLALIKAYETHQGESNCRLVILAEPYELRDYEGVSAFDSFAIVDKYLHPVRLLPILAGVELSASEKSQKANALSVLVVDDNEVNRMVLKAGLDKHNTIVHTCENGLEAVEAFARKNFDLVFMDCEMPVMNGFIASQKIREYERKKNLSSAPIIALTAHLADDIRHIAMESGMNEVMSKPFRKERLKHIIGLYGVSLPESKVQGRL